MHPSRGLESDASPLVVVFRQWYFAIDPFPLILHLWIWSYTIPSDFPSQLCLGFSDPVPYLGFLQSLTGQCLAHILLHLGYICPPVVSNVLASRAAFEPESVQARPSDDLGNEMIDQRAVQGADERAEGWDDDKKNGTERYGDRGKGLAAGVVSEWPQ